MFFRKKKPAGNDNVPLAVHPTLIGAGAVIDGTVVTQGELQIGGTVRGLVQADLCVIETGGRVDGEIEAEEVVVAGQVSGPIHARHVHLQQGARVDGDITSDTIAVDSGAKLNGAVWHRDGGAASPRPAAALPPHDEPRFSSSASLWDQVRADDDRPLRAIRPTR